MNLAFWEGGEKGALPPNSHLPILLALEGKKNPDGSDSKESACNVSSIPGLGSSPGEGHGNPLQYSCLEKSMDRGGWRATTHGVPKSQAQLSD